MSIKDVAEQCTDSSYKKIYQIINAHVQGMKKTGDGILASPISHTEDEVNEIKSLMFDKVKASLIRTHGSFRTVSDVQDSIIQNIPKLMADSFQNPLNNIGMSGIDPSTATNASIPILMAPYETTALYANGGIGQVIIDKKSKGCLLNGYAITSPIFETSSLRELQTYSESIGFAGAVSDSLTNGNIYGGAVQYPVLHGDNLATLAMTERQLFQKKLLRKDCIDYFVSADRWNVVVVPSYNLGAQDYMSPRSFYVPLSGYEVHSDRAGFFIPKKQPYWSAIQQLGWGVPDCLGYLKSLLGYNILISAIPIMAQHMSLLIHQMPLEGIIAQNGINAAEKWVKENEKQLREWSMVNPKAISNFGELKVISRSYDGFDKLVDALRKDISANAGIPESVLFFVQPGGIFSKTEEDVLLKQSETIKMIQKAVTPAINKQLPYLAASLWGCPDWETWQKYKTLSFDFDAPVVTSPSQKAMIGKNYAETMNLFTSAGLSAKAALALTVKLLGDVELPQDLEKLLETEELVFESDDGGEVKKVQAETNEKNTANLS